jgi:hypothetical protein
MVTPSARAELLETVVRLRQRNRAEARRFIARLEERLMDVIDGSEPASEMASPWRAVGAAEGHRLYLRQRQDAMWLIAVWPEGAAHPAGEQ